MNINNSSPAGIRVNIIVLAFTLVSSMTVFLRLFTRLVISRMAGWEDACIVMAMVFSVALAVLTIEQVVNGLGEHTSELDKGQLDILLKSFWASVWVYNLTLTTIKVSILVQYLRIFPVRWFRTACFVILGLVVAYGTWVVSSSILICSPVAFSWDKSIVNGSCMNQLTIWVANAAVNIALDVVIFLMPLFVIRGLSISKSQKNGLRFMFALGASVTLVSIVRLYSLDAISNSTDVAFDNTDHATLSAVEVNVGIICACLPAMRPLFALVLPQYFSEAPRYLKHRTFKIDLAERGGCQSCAARPPTASNNPPVRHSLVPTAPSANVTRPSSVHTRPSSARTSPSCVQSRFSTARASLSTTPRQSSTPRHSITPRHSTIDTNSNASISRTNIASEDSAHYACSPQSVFSRPAGRNSPLCQVTLLSPPSSPDPRKFQAHVRKASNTSVRSTASAKLERCIARLQEGFDSRRMSPISPSIAEFPAPLRIRKTASLPPGSWMRRPSSGSQTRLKTSGSDKQLPLTPFPLGPVG